ncbi:hypothetical protein J2847_002472 [Azospirillum agricola]|uniref:hypothetical protein n=1 Tax=Azospirillum agricola TaxID=1720247 RepID=UPI001AE513F1|nr:hypothetical protein [Azospirillum agricola]MBP2229178.1 hypothetical protein [Azospirillum agricola]
MPIIAHRNVELLSSRHANGERNFGFRAVNFGPLDKPNFWKGVPEQPLSAVEFRRRSHQPGFAADILSRSYERARSLAMVDLSVRAFVEARSRAAGWIMF